VAHVLEVVSIERSGCQAKWRDCAIRAHHAGAFPFLIARLCLDPKLVRDGEMTPDQAQVGKTEDAPRMGVLRFLGFATAGSGPPARELSVCSCFPAYRVFCLAFPNRQQFHPLVRLFPTS
jgi:hypothetical protein